MSSGITFDEFIDRNPLIRFSLYTHLQAETLLNQGKLIEDKLEQLMAPGNDDESLFNDVWGMFWLWVLGSYEMLRTMDQAQARSCFDDKTQKNISELHKVLKQIRVPFAKQEYAGGSYRNRKPIKNEMSVSNWDSELNDIAYNIDGENIWVRRTIEKFRVFVESFRPEDILADHRTSYEE